MSDPQQTIAFQGMPGAYSDLACRHVHPEMTTLPCHTFDAAFAAAREGAAALAMIPIENSVAGRVADIHHLLPASGLHIIAEHYQRVDLHLLAVKGTSIGELTHVHSHVHALNQCRELIRELAVEPVVHADTAGAAADVAQGGDPDPGRHRFRACRPDLRPRIAEGEYRRRRAQHDALLGHGPRRGRSRPRLGARDHQFRLSRAQRSGVALQGHGRLCHQRRQHDQAGELSGRGTLPRRPVLRRGRGTPQTPQLGAGLGGNWSSSRREVTILASTPPTPIAWSRRPTSDAAGDGALRN